MSAYEATRETYIDAPPERCFDLLTDYARLPEWQSRVCECRVLESDEQGRGTVVEYAIDAKFRVVRYRLRHVYDEPGWIGSEYLSGDFKEFAGDYRLQAQDAGTAVSFTLRIDPGFRIPGRVVRILSDTVMGKSLSDLKAYIERGARGA